MKNPIRKIANSYRIWSAGQRQLKEQRPYQVQFYNIWEGQTHDEMYWFRFLKARGMLDTDKRIAFFSVFGDRSLIDRSDADVKIFITGENLKNPQWIDYVDHCLGNDMIDLAMGFEVFEHKRYLRFPLWMDSLFIPEECSVDAIRKWCEAFRYPDIKGKKKFCSMVASNPAGGLRADILNAMSQIDTVDSAGSYMHNDDSLQTDYADNKRAYLKNYYFNICPENTSAYGYTTEKLFEAISAGCIPVYWGAEFADKAVINEDAVIRWNKEDHGAEALQRIRELYANPNLLQDFLSQPRLLLTAEEYILDTFSTIEERLRTIIQA